MSPEQRSAAIQVFNLNMPAPHHQPPALTRHDSCESIPVVRSCLCQRAELPMIDPYRLRLTAASRSWTHAITSSGDDTE